MSNIVEHLQEKRRREAVLESGLKVGYHLPDIQQLIVEVGRIPMDAVAALAQQEEVTEAAAIAMVEASPDVAEKGYRYTCLLVAAMLDDIDGEPVDETDDRMAIVAALDPDDRQELYLIGTRQKDPNSGEV